MPTRVLIVEDEASSRSAFERSLTTEPTIQVVGSTDNGPDAVRMARDFAAEAVLMDIELEGQMTGIEAAIRIKDERPKTGIVILSAHNDRRYVTPLPLEEKPGWAYLLKKSTEVDVIVRAIEASMKGLLMLDPGLVSRLRPRPASRLARLPPRLLRVLALIAEGWTNAAIAERLVLTTHAVDDYTSEIYQELDLSGERDINARVKATIIYLNETRVDSN